MIRFLANFNIYFLPTKIHTLITSRCGREKKQGGVTLLLQQSSFALQWPRRILRLRARTEFVAVVSCNVGVVVYVQLRKLVDHIQTVDRRKAKAVTTSKDKNKSRCLHLSDLSPHSSVASSIIKVSAIILRLEYYYFRYF